MFSIRYFSAFVKAYIGSERRLLDGWFGLCYNEVVMVQRKRTRKLALTALFTALMIMGGFIRIPAPLAPITLQAQIALLAGVCLGGVWGCASVVLYVMLGLIGLPVFASGGGIAYAFQPTFGYLLGFAAAAGLAGTMCGGKSPSAKRLVLVFGVGLLVVYAIGTVYAALIWTLYLKQPILLTEFLFGYVVLTLPKDLVLTALCVPVATRLLPYAA